LSEAVELSAEPKNVLVNSVKMFHNQIQFLFMNHADSHKRLYAMKAMIDGLDLKSQQALAEVREKMVAYGENGKYDDDDLEECFQQISGYLNDTYFREITKGIVSSVTLPRNKPFKKGKPIPTTLPAGID